MKEGVTAELAILIKTLRTKHRIQAKDLAEHIEKSYSYISKLENGDVKTINRDELTKILIYITEGNDFYEDSMPEIFETLNTISGRSVILEQRWFLNYDVALRPVEITSGITEDMAELMQRAGLTPREVTELVNENADSEISERYQENTIIILHEKNVPRVLLRSIVTNDDVESLTGLGNKGIISYHKLSAVLFILYKQIFAPEDKHKKINPDRGRDVLKAEAAFYDKHQIHSLTSYMQYLSSDEYLDTHRNAISSLNPIDDASVMKIADMMNQAAKLDSTNSAIMIEHLQHNMEWDIGFMFKIFDMPFFTLSEMSYTNKKKLLEELFDVIKKYAEMSDFEKKLERY